MPITLAQRVELIKPSATMMVASKASQLKAEGKKIIDLSIGEPDFDTPEHIKAAGIQAIRDGYTKYTPVGGLSSLRAAIVKKFQRENQLTYQEKQIIVTNGAKQAIYNALLALINPGDEVLIPTPFWVSYTEMVILCEGKPVLIPTTQAENFKLSPEKLARAINKKTRMIMLNCPSNPAGVVYSKAEWQALAEVLRQHEQILILTDDIYEHIIWQKPFVNILNAAPDLYERTIVINGVSKSYAMTGWRIGYAAGNEKIIQAMQKMQSQSTSNPNAMAQKAAEAALNGDQNCVTDMCAAYKKRHDFALQILQSTPGVQCAPTSGAFYLFPNISEALKKLKNVTDDVAFCNYLLENAGVAVVPGSPFGGIGHVRISTATSEKLLGDALGQIRDLLSA